MTVAMLATPLLAAEPETRPVRTRAEVEALIEKAGATPPEWWDSVPLNYPETLDLAWPQAKGGWNTRKHIGHYLFSVINENPRRWREGTKFMHHVLAVNKDRPQNQKKAMADLGHCYHDLLEDWARGAFWWRKAGADDFHRLLGLADCYWKLGCREMAAAELRRVRVDYSRYGSAVKLWSDLGDLDRALRLAQTSAMAARPGAAYMGAGDACRRDGRTEQALGFYRKVLDLPMPRKDGILERNKARARIAVDTIRTIETLDLARVPDGVYSGSSLSYNGDLAVAVAVRGGRIVSVRITRHRDKQYFSSIADTPLQIVRAQSLANVDATTGATVTSDAIIQAAAKALAQAAR